MGLGIGDLAVVFMFILVVVMPSVMCIASLFKCNEGE